MYGRYEVICYSCRNLCCIFLGEVLHGQTRADMLVSGVR